MFMFRTENIKIRDRKINYSKRTDLTVCKSEIIELHIMLDDDWGKNGNYGAVWGYDGPEEK